ncbi:MAG: prepilin-type N-terminal cleavage/methylation domain-containing protein [bacterium]
MKTQTQKGFTLIEVMVGISILSIIIFGVYGMYDYSLKMVREKGRREEAMAIANQEIEYFRSINYNILGTAATMCAPNPGGCNIPPVKTVVRNGINFTVITDISYVDDVFDNAGHLPEGNDLESGLNDYKTARVEVRWDSTFNNNSVILTSTFAPDGIETDCGGGILKVNVSDANAANPIPQAGVYIKNASIGYEYDTTTNDEGVLRKGCLPADAGNNYEITINKPGSIYYKNTYSTAQTYPIGVMTPILQNVNINEGGVTPIAFYIDLLSVLNITTITQDLPVEWIVNKNTGDGYAQDMPTIGIGPGDTYYFFWQDDTGGQIRIYGQKYNSSRVAQWVGGDVRVAVANDQALPNVAVSAINGNSYLAWYHNSVGNKDAYIDKISSADGSSLWGVTLYVHNPTNQNDDQIKPKIKLEDNENFFYLTYLDNSNDANDLYATRAKTADGAQEWTSETKMNDDSGGNTQDAPSIVVEPAADNLIAVWQDNRGGDYDIYAQKIKPDGHYDDTWNANVKINEDSGEDQTNPAIDILKDGGGNSLYIVWQDYRNGNSDIYLARYEMNGVRSLALANDINITSKDTTGSGQTMPAIAVNSANGAIYAAWVDSRNGNPDIYMQKFNGSGEAQWDDDLKVNDDQTSGSIQGAPQLAINSLNEAVVTWQDNDAGDYDIKAAVVADSNPTNKVSAPLRIYGSKTIGKDASGNNIYKFDSDFTTNASGELKFDGIDKAKLEWDSYTIEITGGSYNLLRAEPSIPITISPNTANNIILIVEPAA